MKRIIPLLLGAIALTTPLFADSSYTFKVRTSGTGISLEQKTPEGDWLPATYDIGDEKPSSIMVIFTEDGVYGAPVSDPLREPGDFGWIPNLSDQSIHLTCLRAECQFDVRDPDGKSLLHTQLKLKQTVTIPQGSVVDARFKNKK